MRQDIRIIKHYRYPLLVNQSALIKRLRHWEELSLRLDSIPAFSLVNEEIVDEQLEVCVSQDRVKRLAHATGSEMLPGLMHLKEDLEVVWSEGVVHGDLNRKNILRTPNGYRIIDFEPLVTIPLQSGQIVFRTTYPYLADVDRVEGCVTEASDRLGYSCFAAWIRQEVERPNLAVGLYKATFKQLC